jgi:hypothetical protein
VLFAAAGCTQTHWTALPYPIPLVLSAPGGGLMARATIDDGTMPFPLVVDTGTVLTSYDDGTGVTRAHTGGITVFGVDGLGAAIPRLSITTIPLFAAPLGSLGIGNGAVKVGGVLAGDNLSRFAVALDYRAATPTMTMVENVQPCNCEFQPSCQQPGVCSSVIPFALAGGQDSALQMRTRVVIGNDQYSYPPTRVLVDACVEPLPDPMTTTVPGIPDYIVCGTTDYNSCPNPPYAASGIDVRMIVATGFPGVALSAAAYDRLRGVGAAAQLLAGPTITLQLPDAADAGGITAAVTTLGSPPAMNDPGHSALALVSRELFFGPCASLARSRRHRRGHAPAHAVELPGCFLDHGHRCSANGPEEPLTKACWDAVHDNRCDDKSADTPTPAVVELLATLPLYVLPDVTPLLVGINADVRPTDSTVEGIVGTAALARLVSTIDYPGGRLIMRCADDTNCKAYPRLSLKSLFGACGLNDSNFCFGPIDLETCPSTLAACAVAP